MTERLRRTSLYQVHVGLGARMVGFAGWEMPLQYTSVLQEARAVRSNTGLFDVSHMGRIYLEGPQAIGLLEWVVTNGVADLRAGRGRYTCLCNEEGGIIDDAIYYRLGEQSYLLVCNAANRERVVSWLQHWVQRSFPQVSLEDRTEATAMLAFQGPQALPVGSCLVGDGLAGLRRFHWAHVTVGEVSAFASRTGYTGEEGFEFVVTAGDGPRLWRALAETGATPCGLGARDVLRLEASLALHGSDIDPSTTPLEAGLERFVHLEKDFVGVDVLRGQREAGVRRCLVGLRLLGRHIARHGYAILSEGRSIGQVTSGTYSPTLESSIALGYVSAEFAEPGRKVAVSVRNRPVQAEVVSTPFYSRRGQR